MEILILGATATSLMPVIYTSSNTAVATVLGNTLTIVGAGSVDITASQSGDLAYNPASDVIQTLVVSAKPIEITADAQTKVYGSVDPSLTYQVTTGALEVGDSFTGSLGRLAGENVGAYGINVGTVSAGSNYALSYVPAQT